MNVFTCTTRLYKDAEQKFTQGGDSIVTFTGAVDSGFGDKKVTTWIKFNMWGKRGEGVLPYLKDKTQICVTGELSNRKWQDKEGQDRYSLEVRVNELTLVGGKPQQGSDDEQPAPKPQAKKQPEFDESDVPFK